MRLSIENIQALNEVIAKAREEKAFVIQVQIDLFEALVDEAEDSLALKKAVL